MFSYSILTRCEVTIKTHSNLLKERYYHLSSKFFQLRFFPCGDSHPNYKVFYGIVGHVTSRRAFLKF